MTFHCLTRGDLTLFEGFCGVFVCLFCLCFGGFVFVLCFLFGLPLTILRSFSCSRTNDRRSCHGVHGMGEKKQP